MEKLIGKGLTEPPQDPVFSPGWITQVFSVNEKLPDVECGSYLVYTPTEFPKNSRWLVAEYYDDVKGFYSEACEYFLHNVTHWCELPKEPQ